MAQTAPAAEPAAAPAPAKPPEKKGITFTPYGFVLVNAYFDASPFATKDYPAFAQTTPDGGAFLMSARQSRFGFRIGLPEDGWTGAKVNLVLEADFKAGHLPTSSSCTSTAVPAGGGTPTIACTISSSNTASTAWYNGLVRLRLANGTATWKTSYGTWAVEAGQDYGLVNPLFATALAWTADPLFWQAGNIWRRSPQIRLTYGNDVGPVGITAAAAVLSPADASTPVDFGAGNRSRFPDLEGRIAGAYKMDGKTVAAVGVSGHFNKRRYVNTVPYSGDFDATATVFGVDFDFNLPYVELKGEAYTSRGANDTYNAIAPAVYTFPAGATTPFFVRTVATKGGWAQLILTPIPELNLYGGYGVEVGDPNDLGFVGDKGTGITDTSRSQNNMAAFGVIVNASKAWKFGLEGTNTISRVRGGARAEGKQIAFSTKFDF